MEVDYFMSGQMGSQVGDDILTIVRRLLNQNEVKLWQVPYTEDQNDLLGSGTYSKEFIEKYSTKSGLEKDTFITACEHLRKVALSKLAAKMKFQRTGIATLILKPTKSDTSPDYPSLELECSLHITGDELVQLASSMYALTPLSIKLIHQGRIVSGDDLIANQGVKHMSKIMCVCLSEHELQERERVHTQQEQNKMVEKSKQAAKKLAERGVSDSQYFLEIQDQNGKPISLPPTEKEALSCAMALHEKGKVLINACKYSDALVLLCEADVEFNQCRSSILDVVDNYAILSLDLCWCYLNLEQISELSSADERLKRCETAFYRSYGRDLSRLSKLKNKESIQEYSLLVRLYLMQGIVAYHIDDHLTAKIKLFKAEELAEKIKINESSLLSLINMGFELKDVRLALRVCEGDVMASIDYIQQRQLELRERYEKDRAENKLNLLRNKLGKTAAGEQVDADKYKLLKGMGFPKDLVKRALRVSNNDMDQAIQLMSAAQQLMEISPGPEQPTPPIEDIPIDSESAGATVNPIITNPIPSLDSLMSQLLILGADETKARAAIDKHNGDLYAIVNELFFATVNGDDPDFVKPKPEDEEVVDFVANWQGSEDYLDISLDQETNLLSYYLGLLS
ncbi:hypothetical protein LOD99_4260 [Oopsacas minuta]|uniref:UBA domain-containing protein n=1 Tax=Oopsacas minuta TaxID=111878 RepID=A0AAV7JVE2_9METZ|nr:hypothetical protein LOD99_4260 [Oopsacas minuta]